MNKVQKEYLDKYLNRLNSQIKHKYKNVVVDYFCADEKSANHCATLILHGEKTATCSMKYWYESDLEIMPKVGNLQIVTDWHGNPTSIIEITDVSECRFSEVSAEFAAAEGEGDKSLDGWRKAHWDFFSKECLELGIQLDEEMMLILERFQVVYF